MQLEAKITFFSLTKVTPLFVNGIVDKSVEIKCQLSFPSGHCDTQQFKPNSV